MFNGPNRRVLRRARFAGTAWVVRMEANAGESRSGRGIPDVNDDMDVVGIFNNILNIRWGFRSLGSTYCRLRTGVSTHSPWPFGSF